MDLRALRYFVEVVNHNSFSRAAQAVFVTQPTISKMVRALEDELGGPLLVRQGRGVRLTDAGQVVFARGQQLLADAQRLQQEVAEVDGMARGTLTVGVMPTSGHYMAPVLARFARLHPGVTLQVAELGARGLRQAVIDGEVDMTVGLGDEPGGERDPELQQWVLAHQVTRAVFPAAAVADPHQPVRWRELADQPFVLYTSDFHLHQAVLDACAAAGFTPEVKLQTRYWDFLGDLVAANLGVGVMFEHVIARFDPARVASRPLIEPELAWDVVLLWRRGRLSRAARAWLACVQAIYPQAAAQGVAPDDDVDD
ncbi:LysR family transcriptional regulator [Comamonas serinivorans]|uniref:LysR family transcriptional regulator n=1 Tax=Comamonas serinivorans TaxID=1082851 RepID=A0A1Y0EKB5_9BURK|nr:LysR substrate-binding domain-containing protein [Comamonas serinivorans]ARU04083.1 LysR family transcriptional regulator [Comamonas serinivorans]